MRQNLTVRDYLGQVAREAEGREAAWASLAALFIEIPVDIGPVSWARDELHER